MQKTATSSEDLSDEEGLIADLRSGDREATTRFVQTNIGWMRAVARRLLKDEGLAEDAVLEPLIKALNNIDRFERRSKLSTWLHRITVNEALMKLRSRKRLEEEPVDPLLPEFDANACRIEPPWQRLADADEILDQGRRRDLIRSKIETLPESYRIVLMLRDIEEMTTAEVAEYLGITESNVKVRLHRARSALKKILEPLLRGGNL